MTLLKSLISLFGITLLAIATTIHLHQTDNPPSYWIAFMSNYHSRIDIYRVRMDGQVLHRITQPPVQGLNPSWSPNGQWIAFEANPTGSSNDLYRIRPDGSDLTQITDSSGWNYYPSWSPDGQWLAFSSDRDGISNLYKIRSDGSNFTQLTHNIHDPNIAGGALNGGRYPTWSPDGEWIVFTSILGQQIDIYKMRPDGSDLTQLTTDPAFDTYSTWSPDGEWIAFSSLRNQQYELYLMRPDGSNIQQLTDQIGYNGNPEWSPDGAWIAFTTFHDNNTEIAILNVESKELIQLTDHPAYDDEPTWSPPKHLTSMSIVFASAIGLIALAIALILLSITRFRARTPVEMGLVNHTAPPTSTTKPIRLDNTASGDH